MGPFVFAANRLVEAVLGGVKNIPPLARSGAGVIHQQIEPREALARMAHERLAIGRGGDIAAENTGAGFRAETFGRVQASAIGSDNLTSLGELDGDSPHDAPA